MLLVLGLACAGVATDAAARGAKAAGARLVVEDFESVKQGSLGVLDTPLPKRQRGELAWELRDCADRRPQSRCLRVTYGLASEDQQIDFRADLADVDARRFDHLEFSIHGDASAGFSPALRVGLRRQKPGEPGHVEDGSSVVDGIGTGWARVVIPLSHLPGIHQWDHLSAFWIRLEGRRAGEAKHGAYEIDDVALVRTGVRGPTIDDPAPPRGRRAWERAVGGPKQVAERVRETLAEWPRRLVVDRATLPQDDRALLERIARDTWRGLAGLANRENGLPVDHVELKGPDPRTAGSTVADYTNVTNVGLHLISTVAAHELGFVSEADAVAGITRVLDTLDRLETHEGFFFNYYDTTVLARSSHFVSFVDSSWLTAGMMVARSAFPALAARISRRIDGQSYRFFYDDVTRQMSHGTYVNVPVRSEYHYGALFTEARLGSLIAIGHGDVPEDHWYAMVRTYPPEASWQQQTPKGTLVRRVRGHEVEGGYYEWGGERYVPSWGGSMFEALMPAMVVDEQTLAPKSLGRNDETHARLQRRYATEELGYPVWGLSPAVRPDGKGYGEYGAKMLGTLGYGGGAVAPYAAALALEALPEQAVANLRELVRRYDVYGEFGFYDSVDPKTGEVARQYLALDQSMVLISLANYLKDHCIQKLFAADPIARRALPVLASEDFLE